MKIKPTPMKFHAYIDPGHGWLKVNRMLLDTLGIADKITEYSYQRGDWAYLEEDCDASLFITTLKNLGIAFELKHHYANTASRIRAYEQYRFAA